MTQHTEEPWHWDSALSDLENGDCLAAGDTWIMDCVFPGTDCADLTKANKQRIVAAVNGVAGIPTAALAEGIVPAALELLKLMTRTLEEIRAAGNAPERKLLAEGVISTTQVEMAKRIIAEAGLADTRTTGLAVQAFTSKPGRESKA